MRRNKNVLRFFALLLAVSMIVAGCSNRVGDQTSSSTSGNTTVVPETEEKIESSADTTESSTEEVTESSAEEVTEPSTEEVTESSAEEVTEPSTEEVTEPSTEEATEPSTDAPHVHEWSAWETENEATCTSEGVKTRKCSCGSVQSEPISATGHHYQVGVCSCGAREYAGIFTTVGNLQLTKCYWSNGSVITGRTAEGDFMFDSSGNVLAGPYDGMLCPNPAGYVVAYNRTSELLDSRYDSDFEMTINTTRYTTNSYLLDPSGKVIFQTESTSVDSFDSTTYEGEQLVYCNEDRIVTVTYNTYWMGMAANDCTVHLYDMSGNKIADIENVYDYGNVIDGKMIVTVDSGVLVIDKNGQIVTVLENLYEKYPSADFLASSVAAGHHTAFFANGYVAINADWSGYTLLMSEDAGTTYLLNSDYLSGELCCGTLVFSKVISNDTVSDAYYLIDVSKCKTDSDGVVIPTMDAAVCSTPVTYGSFENFFGSVEKYALISTADGKWGYVSYDGQTVKLYDDAAGFSGGYAAVKDGDEFYVIDENFNRVSNSLSGYEAVSTSGNGVYRLRIGEEYVIAVYKK